MSDLDRVSVRRASICRSTRSSRRRNVSQMHPAGAQDLEGSARICAQRLPALLARNSLRLAAASSCCPTGRRCRTRCSSASSAPKCAQVRAWADEVKRDHARPNPNDARCQRQLERIDQGAEARRSTRTRRARSASPANRSPRRRAPSSSGTTIGQYREGDKLIDIVLRQPLDERNAITDLGNAYLPTSSGKLGAADADCAASASAGSRACCGARAATTPSRCKATSSTGFKGATVTQRSSGRACRSCRRSMPPGYSDPDCRCRRGEQQGSGLDRRRRAADVVHHVDAADAAVAQLQPLGARVSDRRRWASRAWPARCCC